VVPSYSWMQPGWPFRTGRIQAFAIREAGKGDRAKHTLATAFQGVPRVALVAI
jgi:hypothetical protein